MESTQDQISDAEMAKKMRKRLKTSFNEAFEAHDKAINSQSDVAKYNSSILRKLEKAFAANPEVDLVSKLPSGYSAALKNFTKQASDERDPLEPAFPPYKRLKTADSRDEAALSNELPKHLQHLQGPGKPVLKATLADSITEFFRGDLTPDNVIQSLAQCELISRDGGSGRTMILKISEKSIVKIMPSNGDMREYSTLTYIHQFLDSFPAPEPQGRMQLNGQDLLFMSYIPGETLEKVWPSLDRHQKQSVSKSLNEIFGRLRRKIPESSQAWGGVGGEGCKDQRRKVRVSENPIRNGKEFEDFFFSNRKFGSEVYVSFLRELYSLPDDEICPDVDSCVLTHGDLRQANIIVRVEDDGEVIVSGIIDWEYSGFYPAYWEAVKLTNCLGCHETSDWLRYLPYNISPLRFPKKWLLDLAWDKHVD